MQYTSGTRLDFVTQPTKLEDWMQNDQPIKQNVNCTKIKNCEKKNISDYNEIIKSKFKKKTLLGLLWDHNWNCQEVWSS